MLEFGKKFAHIMPVDFIQEKKKQKYLIIFFIVIVLSSITILWFGYFKKEKPAFLQVSARPYYKNVQIDFTVLENALFKELQPFEKISPFEGQKGRDNPFLPYSQ